MSYIEQQALAATAEFVNRIEIASIETATAIAGEAGATAGHAARFAYAVKVLHDSRGEARKLAYGVAALPGIGATSDDPALKNGVIAVWNAYAGFNPNG